MPHKIQIPLKMASIIAEIFGIGRYYRGVPCDGGTNNNSGVETLDNLQPETKRRKVQEFMCFNTEYVDAIIGWLNDEKIASIGIYGMAGVGKTTLATLLCNRVLDNDTPFTAVAWVSVGVAFDVYKLQQEIAGSFGLDLRGDEDEVRRAAMINAFLYRNDKFVLFLDDLWGAFRREDVGIPRNCKLIVVSRLLDVCRKLYCQEVVKVKPLFEEESWELFHRSIGYGVLDSEDEDVCRIRKLVYNKCAGLPLAITGLASSLRKMVENNPSSWREVLESSDLLSMGLTHLEDTFSQLKLSYKSLNNIKIQRCFLYAALYPTGYAINREELIRHWMGVGLIDNVPSLQARYNMGHSILNKLLDSCLLEACDNKRNIKIHDLVRHMALSIAGNNFMVEAGIPTKLEFQENLHVVSLMNSSISWIPPSTSLKSHFLSTLLLQHNSFELIPENFFLHMPALRVLNLSETRLIRLPSSIGALEELRVLDLSFCQNLKQVASLSKLLKLRFLDLSQTAVGQVPRSLENLKRLTELNLSSIPEPKKIPCGVLPALFKLKRLACHVVGTIHDELQNVDSLEVLDARFLSLCDLRSYVRSQHWCILEVYHLQVGCEVRSEQPYNRRVSLHGCSLTGQEGDYLVLPSNIQELYVDNCRDFHSLSDVLYPVAYHQRNCQNSASVGSCNREHRFNQQAEVFPSLEICIISRCQDVKTLFVPSWMENLQSLEVLQVEDCRQVKELIAEEVVESGHSEGIHAVVSLPQLRRLVLTLLPQMNSIYKGQLVCASLLSCTFMDCPKLKRLPFSSMGEKERSLPSRLEWIEGQEEWWDLLEWDQPESEASLKPLFRYKSSVDK